MKEKKEKKKLNFSVKVMLGLLFGIIAGIILQRWPDIAETYIKPFGTLYLNAIKMLIVPLVFSSIVVGCTGLGDAKKFGRIGIKTIAIYMLTTLFAATIGVVLANVTNVGTGLNLSTDATVDVSEAPDMVDTLLNIIPSNPIQSMANGDMLQVIAFALFVGAGIVVIGEKGEPLKKGLESLSEVMYAITDMVMVFTPYAVFCLICPVIASNGMDVLLPLLSFVLVVYLGFIIHITLVYLTGVRFGIGMNPILFVKKCWKAIVVSFSTCSSSATVPVTLECAENLGVPLPIRSFTIPLGATVNMDGGAIYQGITALFVAHLFGIDLTLGQQITIVMTAVLASVGTAGVAGASIIMLSLVLSSVGLPLEGIAIVAGVDKLIDMPRTSMNILGDLMCTAIVAKSEGDLDKEVCFSETISAENALNN